MNPRALLALWRARWSKPVILREVPYLHGKVNKWGERVVASSLWSQSAAPYLAAVVALFLFVVLCATSPPLTNQMQFSVGILLVSLFIRRYSGLFVTLTLATLALISSSRYLIWRFSSTLPTELNTDFLLGFCLCSAELIVCVSVALEILRALWPQYRAVAPLMTAPERWPRVDIFLLLAGRSPVEVEAMANQAAAIDWPKKRRMLYLLDDQERIELRELAAARGARYLVNASATGTKVADVNHALPLSHGEFIAVFDDQDAIERNILRTTLGWLVRDLRLGMLISQTHFIAPSPTPLSLAQLDPLAPPQSFALFRRTMLSKISEPALKNALEEPTSESHTALKLRAVGFRSAYVGMKRLVMTDPRAALAQPVRNALSGAKASVLIRVDDPFSERLLRHKQRLVDMAALLAFYAFIPRAIFLIAPLLFLLGGVNLIQTSPELFAVWALPHFLQGLIARARLRGRTRFSIEVDLREGLLSVYLMLRTVLRLLRPGISSLEKVRLFLSPRPEGPIAWASVIWFGTVMLLSLVAVVVGVVDSLTSGSIQQNVVALYVIWCAYNVMQLAAVLAVGEEARSIRQYHRHMRSMPAMLRLASGRKISCTTQNFPDETLELALPSSLNVGADEAVTVSLFTEQREYPFAAHAVAVRGTRLLVTIDDAAQPAFSALGAAYRSRGSDWPQWLPGQHADRLLPVWLSSAIINSLIAVLDFFTHSGEHLRRLRSQRLAFSWKQKK